MTEILVAGAMGTVELQQCIILAEHIQRSHESNMITLRVQRMFDIEWNDYKNRTIRSLGRNKIVARCVGDALVIFGDFAGGLIDVNRYAVEKYNFKEFRPDAMYMAMAMSEYTDTFSALPGAVSEHCVCWLPNQTCKRVYKISLHTQKNTLTGTRHSHKIKWQLNMRYLCISDTTATMHAHAHAPRAPLDYAADIFDQ